MCDQLKSYCCSLVVKEKPQNGEKLSKITFFTASFNFFPSHFPAPLSCPIISLLTLLSLSLSLPVVSLLFVLLSPHPDFVFDFPPFFISFAL